MGGIIFRLHLKSTRRGRGSNSHPRAQQYSNVLATEPLQQITNQTYRTRESVEFHSQIDDCDRANGNHFSTVSER